MFQGIYKSAINDANKNYIFGTGSIPINIKIANLETFAKAENKQQGYQVAEVNKLISTMLTGWDANGNKPKSMSDNYLELILSCDNGFVVKKRLQFPHIIAWQNDSTPYNIADVYKEFSIDNWLKADDFENPDITLVVEPTDEILTTSTANPPEVTTEQSGRFYLYYRNLPVGVNRVHIDFHIKTKTEPIDFDLEVVDGLSWKDAQTILASNAQAKLNVLLSSVKDVYNFTGAEGNFDEITMYKWNDLYQQIISLKPNNKFTHDLYFYIKVLPTQETPVVEPYTEKAYISSETGVIVPMTRNVYSISSPIYLNKGDVLKGIWGIGANVAGLAIADRADATKFEVVLTDDASTSASPREYTATKDCYAFISFFVSNGLTKVKVIKVGQVDKNSERIDALEKRTSALEKRTSAIETAIGVPYEMALMRPICIGDSLTSGASYNEGWGELAPIGSSIDENYPRYLGKMLNCEVKNAGVGGYSASDWWNKYINTDHLDLTQYDSAFIWLGTNYGCSAMPTDAEIESFVPDPNAVASTSNQSLYLIEIIKKLKEAHEDMFIVIMTCFASKSVIATNNQVMRQIAAKYGCYVIDNSDLSPAERPELHCNINNPHFGKAGNIFIANRCCKDVQKILAENPLLCEFGYTARAN